MESLQKKSEQRTQLDRCVLAELINYSVAMRSLMAKFEPENESDETNES